jgi:hypothetical protein
MVILRRNEGHNEAAGSPYLTAGSGSEPELPGHILSFPARECAYPIPVSIVMKNNARR